MRSLAITLALAMGSAFAFQEAPDDLYNYVFDNTTYSYFDTHFQGFMNETGWKGYVLNVTSGEYLTPADSNIPVWSHQVMVFIPDEIKSKEFASMYITGGDMGDGVPGLLDEDTLAAVALALETGTVAATIRQIPCQPIVFASDPEKKERSEDAAVAFTWRHLIDNPKDSQWVLYFPMTRGVVRAIDAVQDYVNKKMGFKPEKWLAYGASKRGWITWLVGAVDDRVVGIAPMVSNLLNMKQGLQNHFMGLGGWTFAFKDYCDVNLTAYLPTDKIDPLVALIDPIGYAKNLTMPKLIVSTTGDEFFLPTDMDAWWPGPFGDNTYNLYLSDAEHSMATGIVAFIEGLSGFWQGIILGDKMPKFSFSIDNSTGTIHIETDTMPFDATLNHADSLPKTDAHPARRDYRLIRGDTEADPCDQGIEVDVFGKACLVPILWWSERVGPTSHENGMYHYELSMPYPEEGVWRGFLGDFQFPGPTPTTAYRFTTYVSTIPQTYPFKKCTESNPCSPCVLV